MQTAYVPECTTKDSSDRFVFEIICIKVSEAVSVRDAFEIELVRDGYVGEIGLQQIITSNIICLTGIGKLASHRIEK